MAQLQDLRNECAAAGLPTWGSIAQLQARLAEPRRPQHTDEDDPMARLAAGGDGDGGDAADDAAGSGDSPGPDPAASVTADSEPAPVVVAAPATGPREFTARYPTHGPPDDQTHANLCRQVCEDAAAAGRTTRGGGRRVQTVWADGQRFEEYAVSVRRQE